MRKWYRTGMLMLTLFALCVCSGCKEGGEVPEGTTPTSGASQVQGGANTPEGTKAPVNGFDTYSEAVMLQQAVEARILPAVERRLPKAEDVVIVENGTLGVYGAEVQFATVNADTLTGALVSEGLFYYAEDGTIAPNIAKSYTVNSDFTNYTIYLREGLRWSDGVLFTADDCVFFYEEMCLPETFGEDLWQCFTVTNGSKKERAVMKKLDAYSFEVTFPVSKPEFLNELLVQGGICFAPEHYHVNLLPEYMGEDAAKAKAKDMGYADTAEMLRETVVSAWNTPGVPTLNSYVLSTEEGMSDVKGNYYEFVRNPYYWKIDAAGKQLPYMDRLGFTRISDESQKMLLTTEGFLSVSLLTAEQVPEAQSGAERGEYRVITWTDSSAYAVKNTLKNFPERCPYEEKIRGIGAAHPECWYIE
ncbi:MAG: hypothetical protein IKT67_07465 [Lachnospiraceae bacterium]|nr:hypothetical protein [Lachnospiraceae bacterium]